MCVGSQPARFFFYVKLTLKYISILHPDTWLCTSLARVQYLFFFFLKVKLT